MNTANKPKEVSSSVLINMLVQTVIKFIIEPIFEVDFFNSFFGFKFCYSVSTALKYVRSQMKECL